MRLVALVYLLGAIAALLLPVNVTGAAIAAVALGLWRVRLALVLSMGYLLTANSVEHYVELRQAFDGGTARLVAGPIVEFPRRNSNGWRATMALVQDAPRASLSGTYFRIELSGNIADSPPELGQWCVYYVRSRRPHAFANFDFADRERQMTARYLVARGAIIAHPGNGCYDIAPPWFASSLRRAVRDQIAAEVRPRSAAAVIAALAVADRSAIVEHQWRLMRETGTAHLLAISGLHVSACATAAFFVVRWLVTLFGVAGRRLDSVRYAWCGSALAALGYAALAGYSIPATRACCMVAVAALAAVTGRRVLNLDNVLVALAVVSLVDPFALLSESTWLSFTAVAVLVAAAAYQRRQGLAGAFRTHCVLAVAIAPMSAVLFGVLPLIAPLANMIVVPWVTVLIVPLVLCSVAVAAVSPLAAAVLGQSAAELWQVVEIALGHGHSIFPRLNVVAWVAPATLLPMMWLLCVVVAPGQFRWRQLGAAIIVGVVLHRGLPGSGPVLKMTVLDVGQGLSVMLQTRRHLVLYDAGPRWWGADTDAAAAVVLPALARAGLQTVDVFVLSHTDTDHAGAYPTLAHAMPPNHIYWPTARAAPAHAEPCRSGVSWRLDGVEFRFLHPAGEPPGRSRNDGSCVLQVRAAQTALLLTGDIESGAERSLLKRWGAALRSDIIVVPHHGSDSSSHARFVSALAPKVAIASAGYRNRYGLPDVVVRQRYSDSGAAWFNTALAGAVRVDVRPDGYKVHSARGQRANFWSSAWPAARNSEAPIGD